MMIANRQREANPAMCERESVFVWLCQFRRLHLLSLSALTFNFQLPLPKDSRR